ncbi:MAG TPA: oligosaccharide flippase family protein [Candidatus Didemnitutus sp.]|nr:oligosaccharide flippase family protein [Candidatus Didemnitutus sp.]
MKISRDDLLHRLLPILCSQALGLACGLVGIQLTSRWVSPADYGSYGVFSSLATVGASVIFAGLVKFISRHWQTATDRPGLLRELAVATARRSLWLVVAAAVVTWFFAPSHRLAYCALLFGSALLLTITQLAQSALQAAREHWRDFGVGAGVSVTRSFLPPLLYTTSGLGLSALLVGFLGQALLGALLGSAQVARWWPRSSHLPVARQLTAAYEGPRFIALAVASWILLGVNRWLVASFFGAEVAGYFTLASNIGTILPAMLGFALLQFVQPTWFAATPRDDAERRQLAREVDKVALGYAGLGLGVTTALHLAMPLLIGTLVSARYASAASFVLASGCWSVAATTGLFYHAMMLAAKREESSSAADLGGAAFLIVGSIAAATAGVEYFKGWLLAAPLVPWILNRPLARRAVFRVPDPQ